VEAYLGIDLLGIDEGNDAPFGPSANGPVEGVGEGGREGGREGGQMCVGGVESEIQAHTCMGPILLSLLPSLPPSLLPPSLPCQMQMRTAQPAGGKNKVLERRKATIELVNPFFHLREREGGREGGRVNSLGKDSRGRRVRRRKGWEGEKGGREGGQALMDLPS